MQADENSAGTYAAATYDGSTNPNLLSYKFQDLNSGSSYSFRVYARNSLGYSTASTSTTIIAANMPPAMSSPTITTVTPNSAGSSI